MVDYIGFYVYHRSHWLWPPVIINSREGEKELSAAVCDLRCVEEGEILAGTYSKTFSRCARIATNIQLSPVTRAAGYVFQLSSTCGRSCRNGGLNCTRHESWTWQCGDLKLVLLEPNQSAGGWAKVRNEICWCMVDTILLIVVGLLKKKSPPWSTHIDSPRTRQTGVIKNQGQTKNTHSGRTLRKEKWKENRHRPRVHECCWLL